MYDSVSTKILIVLTSNILITLYLFHILEIIVSGTVAVAIYPYVCVVDDLNIFFVFHHTNSNT